MIKRTRTPEERSHAHSIVRRELQKKIDQLVKKIQRQQRIIAVAGELLKSCTEKEMAVYLYTTNSYAVPTRLMKQLKQVLKEYYEVYDEAKP